MISAYFRVAWGAKSAIPPPVRRRNSNVTIPPNGLLLVVVPVSGVLILVSALVSVPVSVELSADDRLWSWDMLSV